MGMRLLVLHGPNLNLLGLREGVSGGKLADLDAALRARAKEWGWTLKVVQSNHEGVLLDTLHAERESVDGIVINPAGLFGSYALKEALEWVGVPAIEVHLRPPARESVVGEACVMQVHGTQGFDAYLQAMETFASGVFTPGASEAGPVKSLGRKASTPKSVPEPAAGPVKTLGRKAPAASTPTDEESSGPVKMLGRKAPAREEPSGSSSGSVKTLGRKPAATLAVVPSQPGKTLGRKGKSGGATDLLTRAKVRQKISDRLAGKLAPAELATWARAQYQALQDGIPAEGGQRELLDEALQRLTLSNLPATRLTDEQLVDLLTRLDEG